MTYSDALLFLLPKREKAFRLPYFSYISAGEPELAPDIFPKGKIDLNELLIGQQKAFLSRVQAPLFQDFGFHEGDLLVIHYDLAPKKYDVVLVKEEDESPYFQFFTRKTKVNFVVGVVTSIIKFYKKLLGLAEVDQIRLKPVFSSVQREKFYHFNLNKAVIKHPADTFLLEVKGESMRDARIYDGDLLIVDKHLPGEHQDIIAAYVNGGYTLKYWEKNNSRPKLAPANKAFAKIPIPYNEDAKSEGVIVAAIERKRKF